MRPEQRTLLETVTRNTWLSGVIREVFLAEIWVMAPAQDKKEAERVARTLWDELEGQWAKALAIMVAMDLLNKEEKKRHETK
jgi:hypothetical protein